MECAPYPQAWVQWVGCHYSYAANSAPYPFILFYFNYKKKELPLLLKYIM